MASELIESARYPRHRLTVAVSSLPALTAGALAVAYLLAAPRSPDLAAQLLRARLFGAEGPGGVWDNWWYAGHTLPGYSVLFPALGWLATPQLAGALGAVAATVCFERLAQGRFRPRAWLGSTWFAAGTATELLSGRLAFMTGLACGLAALLALQRRRPAVAIAAAAITALLSPVAAVFTALAALATALATPTPTATSTATSTATPAATAAATATATAALLPTVALAVAFPTGGHEPFALSALAPVLPICVTLFVLSPRALRTIRTGLVLYCAGCILAFAVPTPLGGNAVRLAWLVAGPLAGLLAHPRHRRALLALAVPLLYLQWQGAVRDVADAQSDPSTTAAYYRPLLGYLAAHAGRTGGPTRIEIPFTREHWESLEVVGGRDQIMLARGWERQLDIADNSLFYARRLTPQAYDAWLHRLAVRFVALPDAPLDPSARLEAALIRRRRTPYLRLVERARHWRIYAVEHPTPLITGPATLTALGPDTLTLAARRAGTALVRVRYSPLWHLDGGDVTRDGSFVRVRFPGPGTFVLRNGL